MNGYEKGNYIKAYNRKSPKLRALPKTMLNELLKRLPKKPSVLDLGCGSGVPFDKFLVQNNCNLIGIDNSKKHLALAKKLVKQAQFINGDFAKVNFKQKFNAIVSFYAIFHIPRTEHKKLFKKILALLEKKGLILVTLGAEDMESTVDDFIGSKMMWSSYSLEKNKKLVEQSGFKILIAKEEKSSEHHLWILAQKIN